MDVQQEMYSLQEIFEVVKQLTGFSGDILMQAASGERYVERGGVETILEHIHSGGRADSQIVGEELAEIFEKSLQGARVPYAGFSVTTESGKEQRLYTFRDKDREIVKDVIREMQLPDISKFRTGALARDREIDMEPGR